MAGLIVDKCSGMHGKPLTKVVGLGSEILVDIGIVCDGKWDLKTN